MASLAPFDSYTWHGKGINHFKLARQLTGRIARAWCALSRDCHRWTIWFITTFSFSTRRRRWHQVHIFLCKTNLVPHAMSRSSSFCRDVFHRVHFLFLQDLSSAINSYNEKIDHYITTTLQIHTYSSGFLVGGVVRTGVGGDKAVAWQTKTWTWSKNTYF